MFGAGGGDAQLCPGATYADIPTAGSLTDRVGSGLVGGTGYLNKAAFCAPPAIAGQVTLPRSSATSGWGSFPGRANITGIFSARQELINVREQQTLQFRAGVL